MTTSQNETDWELLCMHCGKPSIKDKWWCSLSCEGYVLLKYNYDMGYSFDSEHDEYLKWLCELPSDYVPSSSDLIHPNKSIRTRAHEMLEGAL